MVTSAPVEGRTSKMDATVRARRPMSIVGFAGKSAEA
jgi:hypothetical protein